MNISELIAEYGYWAVFLGCMLEGETAAILGGIAAHQKLLHYAGVLALTWLGGVVFDQIMFMLGYCFGPAILKRFKKYEHKIERMRRLILRHEVLVIVGIRFAYGLRTIGPLVIGASRVPPRKFILYNAVGAAIWASLFFSIGFLASSFLAEYLGNLYERYGAHILLVLTVLAVVGLVVLRLYLHKRKNARR